MNKHTFSRILFTTILSACLTVSAVGCGGSFSAADNNSTVNTTASVTESTVSGSIPTDDDTKPTSFDVTMTAIGSQKISVIKVVREITGLGLKDATPTIVKQGVSQEEAASIRQQLEEVGAEVTVTPADGAVTSAPATESMAVSQTA